MTPAVPETELYLRLLEATSEPVALLDGGYRFQYHNPAFAALLGLSSDEIGQQSLERWLSIDGRHWLAGFSRSGAAHAPPGSLLDNNGQQIPCALKLSPCIRSFILLHAPRLVEPCLLEAALKANEERFRDFADSASDWMWEMDSGLRFSYFSPRLTETLNVTPDLILGRTRRDLMHEDALDAKWLEHLAVLDRHETFKDFEYEAELPNGTHRFLRISGKALFDEDGGFLGYRGVGRNVTKEVLARREAERLRQRLNDAVESVSEGLLLFDRHDRLVLCNSAYRQAVGTLSSLLKPGLHIEALNQALVESGNIDIAAEERQAWLQERLDQYRRCEKRLIYPVSGGRWIEVNQYRTQDDGTLILRADITERIQAEQALREREAHLSAITDHAPYAVYLKDLGGRFLMVSRRYRELYCQGLDPIGRQADDFHPEELAQRYTAHDQEAIATGQVVQHTYGSVTPDGRELIIEVTKFPVFGADGALIGVGGVNNDVTEKIHQEERLRLAANVFENTQEGVMITDARAHILAVNPAFQGITGYSEQEVIGETPRLFKSGRHEESFYSDLWQTLLEQGQWRGEVWNRRKSGDIYPQWLAISEVRDESGHRTHFVSVFSDISAAKESEQQLEYLAHHDPLTELPNRLLFSARLKHALKRARRDQTAVALLFLDLDHFKHVNDSLGHSAGDLLLIEVADRLRKAVRDEDTVARLGGDEFTLLLEGIRDTAQVIPIADKLIRCFEAPFYLEGQPLHVSPSIGISLAPTDAQDDDSLLRNADTAMYKAKERGRNGYQFYSAEFTHAAQQRVLLERQLREALGSEQFRVYYQPQMDLQSGRLIGAEALVRWDHPEQGLMSPDRFIPLAEETGLIRPLGLWVLQEACRQMVVWQRQGVMLESMAVNFSRQQLVQGDFAGQVAEVLQSEGLATRQLELEITESLIMEQTDEVMGTLDRLRQMGVALAIDDFGTGYSSLAYLKRLPITTLKIDRSFISDVPQDSNDVAIVDAILALANSLELWVVAEGVETEAQAKFLRQRGCQQAQGFLYSRPLPAEAFEQLVRQLFSLS